MPLETTYLGLVASLGIQDNCLFSQVQLTTESLDWYKSLPINTRITMKSMIDLITGFSYEYLILLFGLRETIQLVYDKLKMEGII
jgi:hypothetical protein